VTLWIEWVLCGVVLAVVVYCLFDQIIQEAKKEAIKVVEPINLLSVKK
jgi:hypothetical protein